MVPGLLSTISPFKNPAPIRLGRGFRLNRMKIYRFMTTPNSRIPHASQSISLINIVENILSSSLKNEQCRFGEN